MESATPTLDVNAVRKHLSLLLGSLIGGLATQAHWAMKYGMDKIDLRLLAAFAALIAFQYLTGWVLLKVFKNRKATLDKLAEISPFVLSTPAYFLIKLPVVKWILIFLHIATTTYFIAKLLPAHRLVEWIENRVGSMGSLFKNVLRPDAYVQIEKGSSETYIIYFHCNHFQRLSNHAIKNLLLQLTYELPNTSIGSVIINIDQIGHLSDKFLAILKHIESLLMVYGQADIQIPLSLTKRQEVEAILGSSFIQKYGLTAS